MTGRFGLCFTSSNNIKSNEINWKKSSEEINNTKTLVLLVGKSITSTETTTTPPPNNSINKTFMNLSSLMKYKPCGSCGGAR
jgi:hypothetical protein